MATQYDFTCCEGVIDKHLKYLSMLKLQHFIFLLQRLIFKFLMKDEQQQQNKTILLAWPSGLRRWFKAPVFSEAWVRFPPLPIGVLFSFFFFLLEKSMVKNLWVNEKFNMHG